MSVRFVRVLMSVSSGTFDTHGTNDARNSMGYAIAEVSVGTLSGGRFTDAVKHSPDKRQTATFVSSTDPWHAPDDKMADTEQPGLDFIFTNGITRGLPALVPVGLLYSTPDNALAEIKYLRERGYAISHVEIGEEPDGQHCTPEDYAALYLQWASALHGYDATLKLGGPAFQEGREDVKTWPDANGETSWLKRFIKYLSARGKLGELNFMSFEHYPFEPCANAWTSLADEPGIVRRIMAAWRADGLPTNVPILCTEYNFSWDATAAHQQLAGALWHADFVGSFLAAGGAGAYYYQYEPLALVKNSGCGQWGAFGMFTADASRQIKQKTSQFFSSQLINEEWLKPGREPHRVFAAHTDVRDAKGNELVTAYAVARPDDKWSVMLINKDATHAHALRLQFSNTVTHVVTTAAGARELVQFSSAQYVWHAGGAKGFANPNLPPVLTTNAPGALITLAPASLNVVRCAGP
jgi:hypothetical protein